jgi:hypothetical protein
VSDASDAGREICALRDIQKELFIAREYHQQEVLDIHRKIYEIDSRIQKIAKDAIQ